VAPKRRQFGGGAREAFMPGPIATMETMNRLRADR
jgi:hypothetical protein